MSLQFSLFSSFSAFVNNAETVSDLYSRISVSEVITRKKLCNCGFKNTLKVHSFPSEEIVYEASKESNFVEFKLALHNAVIGIYSNGKIRLAGKMNESLDIQHTGEHILRDILGVQADITPFVTNNMTALFRVPHNITYQRAETIFRPVVSSIVYPKGEVPPYTVIRLSWKDKGHVMINYTPNTGSFQILGCRNVEEVRQIHGDILQTLSENAIHLDFKKPSFTGNKFASVGMKKQGRGRPTASFMKEFETRLKLLDSNQAFLNEGGEFVQVQESAC